MVTHRLDHCSGAAGANVERRAGAAGQADPEGVVGDAQGHRHRVLSDHRLAEGVRVEDVARRRAARGRRPLPRGARRQSPGAPVGPARRRVLHRCLGLLLPRVPSLFLLRSKARTSSGTDSSVRHDDGRSMTEMPPFLLIRPRPLILRCGNGCAHGGIERLRHEWGVLRRLRAVGALGHRDPAHAGHDRLPPRDPGRTGARCRWHDDADDRRRHRPGPQRHGRTPSSTPRAVPRPHSSTSPVSRSGNATSDSAFPGPARAPNWCVGRSASPGSESPACSAAFHECCPPGVERTRSGCVPHSR